MKQIAIQLCGLLLSALVMLFCIQILSGIRKGVGVWSMGRELAQKSWSPETVSENGTRLLQLMEMPEPEVEADDTVYLTEESYLFLSHIRVRQSMEQEWECAVEAQEFSVEILSVVGESGDEGDVSWQNGELCFHRSGRYVVELRITGPHGRYSLQKITIPVEEA